MPFGFFQRDVGNHTVAQQDQDGRANKLRNVLVHGNVSKMVRLRFCQHTLIMQNGTLGNHPVELSFDLPASLLKVQAFPPLPTDPTPEKPVVLPVRSGSEFRTLAEGKRATKTRLYRLHGPRDSQSEIFRVL